MAVTYRFATLADRQGIVDLFTPAMLQELRDDWGLFDKPSLQKLADQLADGHFRLVVADDTGTIRGYSLGEHLVDGRWQIVLTCADKSLTDIQRLTHFRQMMRWVAGQTPPLTPFMGRVKTGGKLDTFLTPRIADRKVVSEISVEFNTDSTEMLAVL